ncbi:hypothetical protein DFH08DRAFT_817768 [Mycena albidolilacea]|uniref:Uncharacterized protein n=1 Tax=Mycena albidolilacea TaxID=1033008 RepID=A0AAD6ZHV1_9AGAR|nr:hypothetical protein DFH08DRAFT_817768 [Mycena albidolilacea]
MSLSISVSVALGLLLLPLAYAPVSNLNRAFPTLFRKARGVYLGAPKMYCAHILDLLDGSPAWDIPHTPVTRSRVAFLTRTPFRTRRYRPTILLSFSGLYPSHAHGTGAPPPIPAI